MDTVPRYPIHEIFTSIQGEGLFVGEPQVFLRLDGCPLRCGWCDSPGTWGLPPESRRGLDGGETEPRSWCTVDEIVRRIAELDPAGHRSLSITGGEPLMWPALIEALREKMPRARLHLETAGAFPGTLARVLSKLDHVSADVKLPADLAPPVPLSPGTQPQEFEPAPQSAVQWREARRAVLALLAGTDACLKTVVAGGTGLSCFDELFDDVRELASDLPLFLQAATAIRDVSSPENALLEALARAGQGRGLRIRVLPQVHVLLGLR